MSVEAKDLLKNGILVETSKGLVCISMKDALTSGVGDLKLSEEDLQNIAQILTRQQEDESSDSAIPYEESGTEYSDGLQLSSLETDSGKETDTCAAPPPQVPLQKRRGGWPKGRKRKPENSELRPPKAPITGYVFYLNERRKFYKDVAFTEVTKLIGAEWSRLKPSEKQKYLDLAEEDKKRYRRELKTYRLSPAYVEFQRRKRLKRAVASATEESDMDATDEIDDDDEDENNGELYCKRCDQWFSSLHNKKEHLYGRTHLQAVERRETPMSFDESSLDGCPSFNMPSTSSNNNNNRNLQKSTPSDVNSSVTNLFENMIAREKEIKCLEKQFHLAQKTNSQLIRNLSLLRDREFQLRRQRETEINNGKTINDELQLLSTVCYGLKIKTEY